ncbi:MAG: 2-C-methyl-D-erythritol 4-phosphate cytidylyltransferase, partial [Peptococcaceae bacterium]|nr:2-C-methyl-D-erythritol 4-phosphate cytidylyltransferase [Peptococcaceae bacterium]
MDRVAAIVPAAGQGKRMGLEGNKLFLSLLDKPVLAHTLAILQDCDLLDEVVVVAAIDEVSVIRDQIVNRYKFSKVSQIVQGGKERQDSVRAGLAVLDDSCKWVVVHDGARPLLLSSELVKIIKKAQS